MGIKSSILDLFVISDMLKWFALLLFLASAFGSSPYTGTISMCNNCVQSFSGYYVNPYYFGLQTYNMSGGFASLNDDTYQIGFYHLGCTTYSTSCDSSSATMSYFAPIITLSGDGYHNYNNLVTHPVYTFEDIKPAVRCKNTVQSCHIQVTNL